MRAWMVAAVLLGSGAPVPFPRLEGRDLAGHDVTVPDSFGGKVLLVCLGFTRQSQYEVEPWAKIGMDAFGQDARFKVLEMPMYSGSARLFRPFIDRGMAGATPPALHGNVVTSTSVDAAAKGLKLGSTDRAAIVLVGPDGTVRFLARGEPTSENRRAFEQALGEVRRELGAKNPG